MDEYKTEINNNRRGHLQFFFMIKRSIITLYKFLHGMIEYQMSYNSAYNTWRCHDLINESWYTCTLRRERPDSTHL